MIGSKNPELRRVFSLPLICFSCLIGLWYSWSFSEQWDFGVTHFWTFSELLKFGWTLLRRRLINTPAVNYYARGGCFCNWWIIITPMDTFVTECYIKGMVYCFEKLFRLKNGQAYYVNKKNCSTEGFEHRPLLVCSLTEIKTSSF